MVHCLVHKSIVAIHYTYMYISVPMLSSPADKDHSFVVQRGSCAALLSSGPLQTISREVSVDPYIESSWKEGRRERRRDGGRRGGTRKGVRGERDRGMEEGREEGGKEEEVGRETSGWEVTENEYKYIIHCTSYNEMPLVDKVLHMTAILHISHQRSSSEHVQSCEWCV